MAALEELREQLDSIDAQMVKLYEKRMRVCASVGKYKIENGKKVADRQREREKLRDVSARVLSEYNKKGIQKLYKRLMAEGRRVQYRLYMKEFLSGRISARKRKR